jgi:hypothetical protein
MMKEGDLCYIPQAVALFNEKEHPYVVTTQKPMSAIYLREEDHTCARLWIGGRQMLANKRHIYPMEGKC